MSPHEDRELSHLREEIHRLALRVDALENHTVYHAEPAAATAVAGLAMAQPNAIPVLGKAVLGLAGAYLLRALAEASPVPSAVVVIAAIAYAAAWLIFAMRADKTNPFEGAIYSLTAALILSPLLWEATVRFQVLPHIVTAAVLVLFAALGSGTAITTASCLLAALALMVGTGDFTPFAFGLLAIAAIAQIRGRMQIPAVIAAAVSASLVVFIMTRPGGVPEHYQPVPPALSVLICAALFLVAAGGIVWRTAGLRLTITVFEIAEAIFTFALALGGTLQITQGRAAAGIGILCALACAACYFTAFLRFPDSDASRSLRRNHHVYAAWGAGLGLVACFLILPDSLLAPTECAAAMVALLTRKSTLALHGVVFLLAAAIPSGLPEALINAFTGDVPQPASVALWIFSITAVVCCAASRNGLVPAVVAAISLGALLILTVRPPVAFLPTTRTIVIAATALAFAITGSRTGRRELLWIAYVAIGLGSLKLLVLDMRANHPVDLAISLLCYGALLVTMPRLRRSAPGDV